MSESNGRAVATVIVPVRNDADGIAQCVRALFRQSVPVEVIVVDDHSVDATAEVAIREGAKVVSSFGRGAAAARNRGMREAETSIVLFTDADCVPDRDWAARLLEPFDDPEVVATKGVYRSNQPESTAKFVQIEYEHRYDRMSKRTDIDFLDTYSLAVRLREARAIGGFDASFPGASVEDQEFGFRLRTRGRFRFVPRAVVQHRHAKTTGSYVRKKFRIGQGKATIARTSSAGLQSDSHTPNSLRLEVGLWVLAAVGLLISPIFPVCSAAVFISALFSICSNLSLIACGVKRHGFNFIVPATANLVLRAVALSAGFLFGVAVPSTSKKRAHGLKLETQCELLSGTEIERATSVLNEAVSGGHARDTAVECRSEPATFDSALEVTASAADDGADSEGVDSDSAESERTVHEFGRP